MMDPVKQEVRCNTNTIVRKVARTESAFEASQRAISVHLLVDMEEAAMQDIFHKCP
jgi:hypothetical protein